MKDRVGLFSFFSGAGFLDLGFEKTGGFETVWVNEFHAPFMEIYKGSRERLGILSPKFGYHLRSIEDFSQPEPLDQLKADMKAVRGEYALTGFIGGPPVRIFPLEEKTKDTTAKMESCRGPIST